MTPLGWTKDLLHQYSVTSISFSWKNHTHTLEKLRMAVGQTGEEKACFLKYIGWSKERNTGRFFTWLQASRLHLPVMDGHTGWEDGAPCHPEIFIHVLDISAEIRDRPQQKWTPGLFSLSGRVGADMGSPKLSEFKGVLRVFPTVAPLGFSPGPRASQHSHSSQRGLTRPGPSLSSTSSQAPMASSHRPASLPVVPSPHMWQVAPSSSCWGWVGLWNTLSKHFPRLVPPCRPHPQTSVHMVSMATFSAVAFSPTTFISWCGFSPQTLLWSFSCLFGPYFLSPSSVLDESLMKIENSSFLALLGT